MSRLYDEIVWSDTFNQSKLPNGYNDSVVFDITDPAHDFITRCDEFSFSPKSYYRLKPPYNPSFFEFKFSDVMNRFFNGNGSIDRIGFHIYDLDNFKGSHGFSIGNSMIQCSFYCAEVFLSVNDELFDGGRFVFTINNEGKPIKFTHDEFNGFEYDFSNAENNQIKRQLNYIRGCVYFSLQLINCKNVVEKEHEPDESLAKKQRKEKGSAQTVYKTLHIDSDSKSSASDGTDTNTTRKHFVRGHFRHLKSDYYSEDKQGTVTWVDPHVRGSSENGVVKKDYKVEA